MREWVERYQTALLFALGLHFLVAMLLAFDPSLHDRPAMVKDTQNELGEQADLMESQTKPPEIVKAEAVDQHAVMEAVERLKQTKRQEQEQVVKQQQALEHQAQLAKEARVNEQKRLQAMKAEEAQVAIAHKKALQEEKKRLQDMEKEKEKQLAALNALKAEQATLKKAAIEKKHKETLQKQQELAHLKQAEDQAKAQAAAAKAAQQAAIDAAKRSRIAGEVDKYKSMILTAIGRQWILPDNVRAGLSSQFKIRLAPNGAVLEVSLMRGSGDPVLDRSAQSAIYKASPLPVPSDAETFDVFREISLTVRPENLRG
ncbi:MAG: cell envelope integrity protein TolA [Gammaproteobacteria bacterium]|nr:cell envelope integrity protein TolA [Gammaproteobacteria bacterium]